MAFLNALAWAIAFAAVSYGALNIVFIVKASQYELRIGAAEVWFKRFLKSSAVAVVSILWLLFG